MAMLQKVVVTHLADRHEKLHQRGFAATQTVVVPAGPVADVVNEALNQLDMPEGRYTITVDWPFEEE